MSINNILSPAKTTTVRDFRHAARIFTDGNFRLSPKYGFLFYVEFDFNPLITSISNTAAQELGMIVRDVTLPKYTIETKTHNAYNRKNIIQNKITYDPINLSFHDDQADNVRNFWYDYYSFFFRDSDYADATYSGTHKYQSRPSFDWGYSPRPTIGYNSSNSNQPYQYIQAIRIYSLYQKNFSEYELVNPLITKFSHGEHSNSDTSSLLKHDMTVAYEAVKYYTGYVTENNVGGFLDLHYDHTPSPIAPKAGTNLVDDGVGGYAQAPDGINDLAGVNPIYGSRSTAMQISYNGFGLGLSGALGTAARLSATAGINSAGFSIPNLGVLTAGLTNSTILGQQLQAAGAALAGTAASTLANGVIGGLASGLGAQGTAIVGLAAQVIANPSQALNVVKNMAINYATGTITNFISNTLVAPLTEKLAIGAQWVGQQLYDFASPLITGVTNAIGDSVAQFTGTGAYTLGNFGFPDVSGATAWTSPG